MVYSGVSTLSGLVGHAAEKAEEQKKISHLSDINGCPALN